MICAIYIFSLTFLLTVILDNRISLKLRCPDRDGVSEGRLRPFLTAQNCTRPSLAQLQSSWLPLLRCFKNHLLAAENKSLVVLRCVCDLDAGGGEYNTEQQHSPAACHAGHNLNIISPVPGLYHDSHTAQNCRLHVSSRWVFYILLSLVKTRGDRPRW